MDISSATARVAPDLLKALAILSDTTVRRSAVDREDLKPYWKSEILNMCQDAVMEGFRIFQDFKYAKFLHMQALHKVLNMPEYD